MPQRFYYFYIVSMLALLLAVQGPHHVHCSQIYTKERMIELREKVRVMFQHAYDGYLRHASEYDELRPLTCDGVDTWGSYSLTLIDALDTLATMGNFTEFRRVAHLLENMDFDMDINVSVFETNIRIVGGLLSAHLLFKRAGMPLEAGWPCEGPLLRLAENVARRLLPAFDTTTGMPYGTVNLRYGVPKGETAVTCTAGVGTFLVEFGALSRLTGNPIYETVALKAVYSLWERRSVIGLFGNHIDVQTGRWTALDAGIGAGVDSYFEYLVKGAILLNRPELLAMFNEARHDIDKYLKRDDWYVWVNMNKGQVTMPVFQSLEAFWPGLLSMIGDIAPAMRTIAKYTGIWRKYGFLPEFFNIPLGEATLNRESYPLRPELIESAMYLYRATKNHFLLELGEKMLETIEFSAKTRCGYATIRNVVTHEKENRMESFYLAETTKYLYMLFDETNFMHNDGSSGERQQTPHGECIVHAGAYIFNTEAHPVDMSALHCCHDNREDVFDGLDLDAYSDEALLKVERERKVAEEEMLGDYLCSETNKRRGQSESVLREPPSGDSKKTESTLEVDIEVYDEDNNPAGEMLVKNFERIKLERQHMGRKSSPPITGKPLSANHLTVTDLTEFFNIKRENFKDLDAVLNYVVGFMRKYSLDATFISSLHLLDKNVTAVLGEGAQLEYERHARTLWELFELQQKYLVNIELWNWLHTFNKDDKLWGRILTVLNSTGDPSTADPTMDAVLQRIALLRAQFENALVNTTAMQQFLLKILINGTDDKRRTVEPLLTESDIAALPVPEIDSERRKKLFRNVQHLVEVRMMISKLEDLESIVLEKYKQGTGDAATAELATTVGRLSDELQNVKEKISETAKAATLETSPKEKTFKQRITQIKGKAVSDSKDVEDPSLWSQLLQTILRKTTQQRAEFDEELLLKKARLSLQYYASIHAQRGTTRGRTKTDAELFTCQRPNFVEKFAYREYYP